MPPSEKQKIQRLGALRGLLRPERLTIVADVGASPLERPPYAFLLAQGACEVWGFEPQQSEYDRLVASAGPHEHYLPVAIGDGSVKRLNLTRHPGFTSMLTPNRQTSAALNRWHQDTVVEAVHEMATTQLDALDELPDFDLLKIDIQGGEMEVFRHGRGKLSTALAVITETAAIPIYENQPLIGDQMLYLGELGFSLHKFAFFRQVPFRGRLKTRLSKEALSDQLTDGDAIFIRALLELDRYSDEQLKHLCILADFVFESPSLALRCLEMLIKRGAVASADSAPYLDLLG